MFEYLAHLLGPVAAVTFILLVLAFCAYMGVFQGIYFVKTQLPATTFVGLKHVGPYRTAGPTFLRVRALVAQHKLEDIVSVYGGIYHDDPKTMDERKCRSFLGFSTSRPLTDTDHTRLEESGLRSRTHPPLSFWTTCFPFRNTLSYIVAAICVYPAMNHRVTDLCSSVKTDGESGIIELYHTEGRPDKHIQFLVPADEDGSALADIDLLETKKKATK